MFIESKNPRHDQFNFDSKISDGAFEMLCSSGIGSRLHVAEEKTMLPIPYECLQTEYDVSIYQTSRCNISNSKQVDSKRLLEKIES